MSNESKSSRRELARSTRVLDFPSAGQGRDWGEIHSGHAESHLAETVAALNARFDGWSSSVSTARMIGGFAVVTVRISSSGVSREGMGFSEALNGEGFVVAERDAFNEAASRFLVSRPDLPSNEIRAEASSISDLISYRQLREIKVLATENGVDADKESERRFGVLVSELSRAAADRLISDLEMAADDRRSAVKLAG